MNNTNVSALEQHKNSVDTWWRTHSATMALLKHAYLMIEEAEKRISEQEDRIITLEGLAATDELTGLLNRRGFELFFDRELSRIKRHRDQGGLFVLIDLDGFKNINDVHGHLAGDACLRLVGEKIRKLIRGSDGAGRLGGDEMVILLTQTDTEDAAKKSERIQHELNNLKLMWEGREIALKASMGTAPYGRNVNFAQAYHAADVALYGDKRNRKSAPKN